MSITKEHVFEVLHQEWDEFPGNELYDSFKLAQEMGKYDYRESFPGIEPLKWEYILKNFLVLYEDGQPTDVTMRIRIVHSEVK